MDKTFFNFKLDLEPNIIDMLYDLLRMSTIQIITQIMFYMNNSSLSLFSETFIKTFVFINISIIFYYLVVRKVFSFISDDYLNTYFKSEDKPYAGTPPIGSSNNTHSTTLRSGLSTANITIPPTPLPSRNTSSTSISSTGATSGSQRMNTSTDTEQQNTTAQQNTTGPTIGASPLQALSGSTPINNVNN